MMLVFWLIVIFLGALAWFSMRGRAVRRIEATRDYARRATEEAMRRKQKDKQKDAGSSGAAGGSIEELVKCTVCGAYVSPKAAKCSRTDCPV